jgi:hypothetical protein
MPDGHCGADNIQQGAAAQPRNQIEQASNLKQFQKFWCG